MDVPLALAALGALVLLMVVVPVVRGFRKRRRRPEPVVWKPDERPDEVRLESYAEELLRDLARHGIGTVERRRRAEADKALPW